MQILSTASCLESCARKNLLENVLSPDSTKVLLCELFTISQMLAYIEISTYYKILIEYVS